MGERGTRLRLCACTSLSVLSLMLMVCLGCQAAPAPASGDAAEADAGLGPQGDAAQEQPDDARMPEEPDTPGQDNGLTDAGQQDEPVDDPAVNGDLNGDGVIDAADVRVFADALPSEKGEEGFIPELDLDGDDRITFVDYQLWYDLVFGSEP